MNAAQMKERFEALQQRHLTSIGYEVVHVPSTCDFCFLVDVTRTAVNRLWDPFTGGPLMTSDKVSEPIREMTDGSPCWCVSFDEPNDGWIHAPRCVWIREWAAGSSGG